VLAALKRLSGDTLIYGTSTVVSRFLTFLLVPFYTNLLAPGELGVYSAIYSWIAFVSIVFTYGMEAAYFRFAADSVNDKKKFSAPFITLLGSSLFFAVIIVALKPVLNEFVNPYHTVASSTMNTIVVCSVSILFFDALSILPFAALRLQHKPARFAVLRFINIFLQVVLNLLFVAFLHYGVAGIFLGNAIASVATFIIILPTIRGLFAWTYSRAIMREFLGFGLPYVPSSLSTIALQVIDRPIMQRLTNDPTVGIYSANYRLGTIMMVFVSMFEYAWRPFFLQYARQPDAKRVFSRVLTYFTLAAAAIFLIVSFFVGDLARIVIWNHHSIIDRRYWGGLTIVPIVLAAYIFNGFYTNFIVGIYVEKRTRLLPVITGVAALSNIIGNLIMIPIFGIAGAAWATFISYALMAVMIYRMTQPFYPMQYEWGRIGKIASVTLGAFLLSSIAQNFAAGAAMQLMNVLLLALTGAAFFFLKFFSPGELSGMQGMLRGFIIRAK